LENQILFAKFKKINSKSLEEKYFFMLSIVTAINIIEIVLENFCPTVFSLIFFRKLKKTIKNNLVSLQLFMLICLLFFQRENISR